MPDHLTELDFTLEDVIGGQPLTPKNVDLPTLRGFLEKVETLIKGDVPGASLADSQVRLEEGAAIDEQDLASLWEKGRNAWNDVESAADWVEELRGNA